MRVNPSKYWPSKLSVKKWKCQSSYKPVFNMHNSVTFSTVHQIKRCKMINWKGKLWSDVVAKIYPKFILISVQRESIVNIQHVPWPLIDLKWQPSGVMNNAYWVTDGSEAIGSSAEPGELWSLFWDGSFSNMHAKPTLLLWSEEVS